MKDEDFHKQIQLPYKQSKKMWEQLSHDTRFLATLNIMDYSLLLGIYYIGVDTKNLEILKENNDNNSDWNFINHRESVLNWGLKKRIKPPPPPSKKRKPKPAIKPPNGVPPSIKKASIDDDNETHIIGGEYKADEEEPSLSINSSGAWTSAQVLASKKKYNKVAANVATSMDTSHIIGIENEDEINGEIGHERVHSIREIQSELNSIDTLDVEFKNEINEGKGIHKHYNKQLIKRKAISIKQNINEINGYPNSFQANRIEGPGFYIMGIIDILQDYNWNKKMEHYFKVFFRCKDKYGISCIQPNLYQKRFLAKMLQIGIGRNTNEYLNHVNI